MILSPSVTSFVPFYLYNFKFFFNIFFASFFLNLILFFSPRGVEI